jgi:hypothetical protein
MLAENNHITHSSHQSKFRTIIALTESYVRNTRQTHTPPLQKIVNRHRATRSPAGRNAIRLLPFWQHSRETNMPVSCISR